VKEKIGRQRVLLLAISFLPQDLNCVETLRAKGPLNNLILGHNKFWH